MQSNIQTAAEYMPQWAVIELYGRKVIGGLIVRDDSTYGYSMLRVDIPETSSHQSYTRFYNPSAVFSITLVSEEVARLVAEKAEEEPAIVFIPELSRLSRLQRENQMLKKKITRMLNALNEMQADQGLARTSEANTGYESGYAGDNMVYDQYANTFGDEDDEDDDWDEDDEDFGELIEVEKKLTGSN